MVGSIYTFCERQHDVAIEDGDPDGWTALHDVRSLTVARGVLTAASRGPDPALVSPTFSVAASQAPSIEIRLRVTSPARGGRSPADTPSASRKRSTPSGVAAQALSALRPIARGRS